LWVFCAAQWQECVCQGKVRWGARDTWLEIEPKAGKAEVRVKCDVQTLVDVLPGDSTKHCQCSATPGTLFYNSINPGLLPPEGVEAARPYLVASCELFEKGARDGPCGARQWAATAGFCGGASGGEPEGKAGPKALDQNTLRLLMRAWVEPRYLPNYRRLYNASGWTPRAFVNYYAGAADGKHARMTEELVRSVHLFSAEPIVVVHFGFATVTSWDPKKFPRLVLLNAAPLPTSAQRSFHFNKLRALLLSRALVGVEQDSDQFVAPGVDAIFRRTEEEVTQDYPLPILPAHFWPFGPQDRNLGGNALWARYCKARDCKWQTARWGHAHPTWTFWALPFLGRWLRRNLRDEWLPPRRDGAMPALRVTDVSEDEDLLNVGTWEEGGRKQWCKFDMPDPTEFDTLLAAGPQQATCFAGMCGDIQGDPRFNPHGVAKVFYTAHHAVDPKNTRHYVDQLAARQKAKTLPPPILYAHRFYRNGEELRQHHAGISCLI